MKNWDELIAAGIRGQSCTREQALEILATPDDEILGLVAAAGQVRRHWHGRSIALNYLVNIKSGFCPEDCHYCSQSKESDADILRYTWLDADSVRTQVEAGIARGASTVCLVSSGRQPGSGDIDRVGKIVAEIKDEHPDVHVCACLGFLTEEKARQLAEAGVSRYNHNLNTAKDRYPDICSTHTYEQRKETVEAVTTNGISACSGLIAGMGESPEQLVDVVFALREINVDSVPVNFLLPFEGTPLELRDDLTPQKCLKILAMVRFVHPDKEVRSAAGREFHIRTLQPLVLEICNSIFLGDYLTSEGQKTAADLQMIADMGFEIVGTIETQAPMGEESGVVDKAGIPIRRRGAGAEVNVLPTHCPSKQTR